MSTLRKRCGASMVTTVLALVATAAVAQDGPVLIVHSAGVVGVNEPKQYDLGEHGLLSQDDGGRSVYEGTIERSRWAVSWRVVLGDNDIDSFISVTSRSDFFHEFLLVSTVETGPKEATTIDGAVSAVITNEFNLFAGAIVRAVEGGSFYQAFYDVHDPELGAPVRTMMDDPFAVITEPVAFGENEASASFGPQAAPGMDESVALVLQFEVSPGDVADVSGVLRVAARPACPADVDVDGKVGLQDLLQMLNDWGVCVGCPTDLDGDGRVGFADLLRLIAEWGICPVA